MKQSRSSAKLPMSVLFPYHLFVPPPLPSPQLLVCPVEATTVSTTALVSMAHTVNVSVLTLGRIVTTLHVSGEAQAGSECLKLLYIPFKECPPPSGDPPCQNGSCYNGTCSCYYGYTGLRCDTRE